MIPRQKAEEVLEAIWNADEAGEFTLDAVRTYCPEEISDGNLQQLEADGLLIRQGERILFTPEGKERAKGVIRRHRLTESLLTYVLGLPESAVRVFMKTIIRREAGAVELDLLAADFSNLQLVVTLLTMTLLIPCVNTVVVLFKERGARVAGVTLAGVFAYALLAGGLVNHACRSLGITFG